MELPRSSSDFAFAYPCRTCLGNGGIGLRRPDSGGATRIPANFQTCTSCDGSGWSIKRPADLTPAEAEAIRAKLQPIPPDPETEYNRESVAETIQHLLTGHHIETVALPEGNAAHIDLISPTGCTIRILPEFRERRFHNLIAIPQPPEP